MSERTLPAILDGKFFRVVEELENGNIIAQCVPCEIESKRGTKRDFNGLKKGSYAATSNFLKHLKSHSTEHEEYKNYLKTGRKKDPAQTFISGFFPTKETTAASADEKLQIDYIIESMSPLHHVELPSFRRLIKGLKPSAKTLSYRTLSVRINAMYLEEKRHLEKILNQAPWVCCTADLWSSRRRSYLGVTCHWITPQLKRESAVIAFQMFKGGHNFDRIAVVLNNAFRDVKIPTKIVCCVTDNGSNFVKAFRKFGLRNEDSAENNDMTGEDDDEEATIQLGEDGIVLEDEEIVLPMHIRCGSHTLSLVATEDFVNTAKKSENTSKSSDAAFKKVIRSSMSKCTALWNKISRSNQVAEAIVEICGKNLKTPCTTRWNSLFDSSQQLLQQEDHFEEIFEQAGLPNLSQDEIDFMKDYVTCMEPIAIALDKLQEENNIFYGYFAPIILATKNKLDDLINNSGARKNVKTMAEILKVRLQKRFEDVFAMDFSSSSLELMSAISLPFFKLRWVPSASREAAKATFIAEAKRFFKKNGSSCQNDTGDSNQKDNFYSFESEPFSSPSFKEELVELECLKYLQDPSDNLHTLVKYPTVKAMFLYFNTPFASSAPVKRLFSYAGLI